MEKECIIFPRGKGRTAHWQTNTLNSKLCKQFSIFQSQLTFKLWPETYKQDLITIMSPVAGRYLSVQVCKGLIWKYQLFFFSPRQCTCIVDNSKASRQEKWRPFIFWTDRKGKSNKAPLLECTQPNLQGTCDKQASILNRKPAESKDGKGWSEKSNSLIEQDQAAKK